MMPGKTMIGGTAYDVKPGSVMVGGTVYTIKEGKTMVDGTAYSIKFAGDVTVTITGKGSNDYLYVIIAGTKYISGTTVEVQSGTEIYCYAYNTSNKTGVFVNGVKQNSDDYTFEAYADVKIALTVILSGIGKAEITL